MIQACHNLKEKTTQYNKILVGLQYTIKETYLFVQIHVRCLTKGRSVYFWDFAHLRSCKNLPSKVPNHVKVSIIQSHVSFFYILSRATLFPLRGIYPLKIQMQMYRSCNTVITVFSNMAYQLRLQIEQYNCQIQRGEKHLWAIEVFFHLLILNNLALTTCCLFLQTNTCELGCNKVNKTSRIQS